MTNADAVRQTIEALIERGSIDANADAARIELARSLAGACDVDISNASLWREYRAAEAALFEQRESATDAEGDNAAALSAPVGDAKDTRTPHSRRSGRRGGG